MLKYAASARGQRHARPSRRADIRRSRHGPRHRGPGGADIGSLLAATPRTRLAATRATLVTPLPRERFGQHFLVDPGVRAGSSQAIDPRPGDRARRDRPGRGRADAAAAREARALTVIELDRDLVRPRAGAERRRSTSSRPTSSRSTSPHSLRRGPLRIVGNLPYNISTPILFHCLDQSTRFATCTSCCRRRSSSAWRATPGGKDYGRLTVMLQWRLPIEPLFALPPAPSVRRRRSIGGCAYDCRDPRRSVRLPTHLLANIVRAAFGQRRSAFNALSAVADVEQIAAAGVDRARAPRRFRPRRSSRSRNRADAPGAESSRSARPRPVTPLAARNETPLHVRARLSEAALPQPSLRKIVVSRKKPYRSRSSVVPASSMTSDSVRQPLRVRVHDHDRSRGTVARGCSRASGRSPTQRQSARGTPRRRGRQQPSVRPATTTNRLGRCARPRSARCVAAMRCVADDGAPFAADIPAFVLSVPTDSAS